MLCFCHARRRTSHFLSHWGWNDIVKIVNGSHEEEQEMKQTMYTNKLLSLCRHAHVYCMCIVTLYYVTYVTYCGRAGLKVPFTLETLCSMFSGWVYVEKLCFISKGNWNVLRLIDGKLSVSVMMTVMFEPHSQGFPSCVAVKLKLRLCLLVVKFIERNWKICTEPSWQVKDPHIRNLVSFWETLIVTMCRLPQDWRGLLWPFSSFH